MKLHIGNEIRRVMEEKGIQPTWVAKKISTSQRNFYDLLKREAIGTDQLAEISTALEYDFFALYSKEENIVNEPNGEYKMQVKEKISVLVELDGKDDTLKKWIKKLTAINEVI